MKYKIITSPKNRDSEQLAARIEFEDNVYMLTQKMTIFKLALVAAFFISDFAYSQGISLKNKNPYPTKYLSASDDNLVIKTVVVAPTFDNVDGVYKSQVDELLKELISKDIFWAYTKFSYSAKNYRLDDFENKPEFTLKALNESAADGLITCFILKGPQGINIQLNLFTKDKGLLLIREDFQDATLFEINKVKDVVTQLYGQMKSRLPYSGFVTSRKGNAVTLNVGAKSGVKVGDVVTIAQVVKINRHPKTNFMVGVEKEIIGRINLTQVEEQMSVGEISFEKETGVVTKGSKVLPLNFVKYSTTESSPITDSFPNEKSPYEWLPSPTPQFGKIHILGGFSDFTESLVLQDGTSLDSGNRAAPTINLSTELWITPDIFANIDLRQMIFKGTNSLVGSTPGELNFSVSRVEFSMGYKYLIEGNFWGPQIYSALGYLSHTVRTSDSTPLTSFTTYELTGLSLTAGGLFPVSLKKDWAFGAQAKFMVFERFDESPVDSGKANADFSEFDLIGTYQYTTNINFKGQIVFTNIQTSFNQNGNKTPITRSFDEKTSSYLFGFEYMF